MTTDEGSAESAAFIQGLLNAASACGLDSGRLARDAGIPGWALSAGPTVMLPLGHVRRVWELVDHALGSADAPLAMASRFGSGGYGLPDYLFATAPTVRDGLAAVGDSVHLISTNCQLGVETSSDRAVTWTYHWRMAPSGRAAALAAQFMVVSVVRRIQMATGSPVAPTHVAFIQDPPRSHRTLIEALGTARVDFAAPLTTFTFAARDLDRPLRGADAVLAGILTRYVKSLSPAPPADWRESFRVQLAHSLAAGTPTLAEAARRMAISTRTVQRRLAEYGTTWRAELDAVRQRLASSSGAGRTALARRLGYADERSVRRVMRRWESRT